MKRPIDRMRVALSGIAGTVALAATAVALSRATAAPWLAFAAQDRMPHGRVLVVLVAVVFAVFVLAWVYATWFDELLTGNALNRGVKFGAFAWLWVAALAALIATTETVRVPRTLATLVCQAGESFAAMIVVGIAISLTYGAGREHSPYLFGLGYGLPDRRSLG